MAILKAGDREFDVDVVVFDKDGLLFDSLHFWKCLAQARIRALSQLAGSDAVRQWCRQFGICEEDGLIVSVNPNGIFALASPQEEVVITASILLSHFGGDWAECRRHAADLYDRSDREFDLAGGLLPKQGFPGIFARLQEAGITYGIATSDDLERTRRSLDHFGLSGGQAFIVTPVDVERGKPYPDMLELVARRTGADPGRIAMIGDSFVDVQMARNAGSIGIGIPDDPKTHEKMLPFADSIVLSLDHIFV